MQQSQSTDVADVVVAADRVLSIDAGLSAALAVWTDELNHGDVSNWHRHAVEAHSLRNALRVVLPLSVERMPVAVTLDERTIEAVRAAARTCAASGTVEPETVNHLRDLADEAMEVLARRPTERNGFVERRQRRRISGNVDNRRQSTG